MKLNAVDVERIRNFALIIYFCYFLLLNLNRIRFLIATMADTANRPRTPSRKLFKAASKTKTPKQQQQIPSSATSTTPRSVEPASIKSSSPSPGLFKSSGASPKLVRKASSQVSTTPSKPSPEDVMKTTPLAPLSSSSKIFVAKRRKPASIASDTTGGTTPIGLIDNEALTPTDTVGHGSAHKDPEALSRELSEVMTGAGGGLPYRDSTPRPGSAKGKGKDKQSETATNATRSVFNKNKRAADAPKAPEQVASNKKPLAKAEDGDGDGDAAAVKPPSPSTTGGRDVEEESASVASSSIGELDGPRDWAKYFTDQGHHEMSSFIKALLLAPEEEEAEDDPASAASGAIDSAKDKIGQATADKKVSDEDADPEPALSKAQNGQVSHPAPGASDPTSPSSSSTQRVGGDAAKAKDAPAQSSEAVRGFPETSSNPIDELPTNDDLIADPAGQLQDKTSATQGIADTSGQETVSGFPDVSTNVVEQLPNSDDLVVGPTSDAQDTLKQNIVQPESATAGSADQARDTSSGLSDGSPAPVDALPAQDDLAVTDPAIQVSDATKASSSAIPTDSAPAPVKEQATSDKVARDASLPTAETRIPADVANNSTAPTAPAAPSDKIGVPDTEGIVKGKDIADSDHTGKPLDLESSIPSHPQDLQPEEENLHQAADRAIAGDKSEAADNLPDHSSTGAVISKATQDPAALDQAAMSKEDAPSPSGSLPPQSSTEQANGSAQAAMAGAKDDLGAKAPQQPSASDAPKQSASNGAGGIQAQADNMGKPAHINRRIDIPLPRPERRPSSKPGMDMPEVDKLRSTDGLNNVNDLEDPPEEFLDPSVHSPQQPSANISPVPKIQKVNPIDSQPPPELARLANGLAGYTVDDVGNVVDESGKVLGHATGDLPCMIGKKIADNGEVYGDNGELIGYVTENFTGHPAPAPDANKSGAGASASKDTPLPGGLRVDHEGNILDASGNVIGKMHSKPTQPANALGPFNGKAEDAPKTETNGEQDKPEGEKPKAKFEEGGIPADIFLDVKSTPDGIQVTIRIPTIFKQETRQTTQTTESTTESGPSA
ncbi:hypothetical protein BJ166DRAFT_588141 [Pestalotiopsis sp. NC0098]|nr:hypothetical protein BJ166DRAFT_588141 [Pestalotiopsis sp. NC0098]